MKNSQKQKGEKRKSNIKDRILICGNEAIGEAAIKAGCDFYAGYPITPQNELTAYMAKRMPEEDRTFIQSESELAAINMLFGASAAGARVMTSSSSPGISLKQEGISYIVAAELPALIVNMMRGGPGLGNIAPSQADYFQAIKGGGHGDYNMIVLGPASVQELYDLGIKAFGLADKYRTPVMILGDGMLGQMMEPISFTQNAEINTQSAKPWALTGCKNRSPNIVRSLHLGKGNLEKLNQKLQDKYKKIEENEVMFESFFLENSEIILIAYGSVGRICKSAVQQLREEGRKVGLLRPITLFPFPEKKIIELAFKSKIKKFLVVEMSSGQMLEDVKLAVEGRKKVNFLGRMGGEVPEVSHVKEKVREILDG